MTTIVSELYTALRAAGVEDDIAKAAARAVLAAEDKAQLVTRADLAEAKTEIIKWNVATMGLMTAIYSAISIALRFAK